MCLPSLFRIIMTIIKQYKFVVCFLLCNSQASEIYMSTFRNSLCFETSAYKIQTQRNYPEEGIQLS
jgi:hypothetical protein